MTDPVTLFEVGPRDGLQNQPGVISTANKVALIDLLSQTGLTRIEAASFVSPRWVPQMGDAGAVMAGITRAPDVEYSALTPNLRGYQAARAAHVDAVAVFAAASETFSQKNINCTIAESLERFAPILSEAAADGLRVRGYISCVTDCPYEGPTAPASVADLAAKLLAMGCAEISLGDTIGQGTPERVDAMLSAVLDHAPADRLAGHFHDTAGRALDNIEASLARGLRVFDAAVGGLGGCPYAPGAAGNVATEAVLALLDRMGHTTGVDAGKLADAARFAAALKGS